jgi:hypothetical protein
VFLVIDDDRIKNRHGLFTKEDVERVWCDEKYRDMHDELLELMKAFRLCYKKKSKDEFIIPSLLTPDPPANELCRDDADALRLQFYYEFMPKGIVNQLTAELYRYIPNDECVWSRGVVFEDEEASASVIEEWGSKLIRVSVKGKDARGFMRLVMGSLDDIHDTYPGIEVIRQVPCQCKACINNARPTIFEYDKLIKRLKQGKKTIICNEGDESLEIEKILYNIGINPENAPRGDKFTHTMDKNDTRRKYIRVFISFSKADIAHVETLKKILRPFERSGDIETWFDRDMMAGDEWNDEILEHLERADIILFLVSLDFLSTDYIWDKEIPMAIERHEEGEAKVIPIILRPCAWED